MAIMSCIIHAGSSCSASARSTGACFATVSGGGRGIGRVRDLVGGVGTTFALLLGGRDLDFSLCGDACAEGTGFPGAELRASEVRRDLAVPDWTLWIGEGEKATCDGGGVGGGVGGSERVSFPGDCFTGSRGRGRSSGSGAAPTRGVSVNPVIVAGSGGSGKASSVASRIADGIRGKNASSSPSRSSKKLVRLWVTLVGEGGRDAVSISTSIDSVEGAMTCGSTGKSGESISVALRERMVGEEVAASIVSA
jgi:hypothetical protein